MIGAASDHPRPSTRGLAPSEKTYHRLVRLKRRLPEWLRYRLDPYNTSADRFVAQVAAEVPPGAQVLDAGAGECRHSHLFGHARYASTDNALGDAARWDYSHLSFVSDLEHLPLPDEAADVVLNVNVLEHVADPVIVLSECRRVLRPGGRIFLVAPQSWLMHQAPQDYYRFTRYGLEHVLRKAGFEVVSIRPVGGAFWNLGSRSLYLLSHFEPYPLALLLSPFFGLVIPLLCFYLDRLDRRREDTLGHTVVARRKDP